MYAFGSDVTRQSAVKAGPIRSLLNVVEPGQSTPGPATLLGRIVVHLQFVHLYLPFSLPALPRPLRPQQLSLRHTVHLLWFPRW